MRDDSQKILCKGCNIFRRAVSCSLPHPSKDMVGSEAVALSTCEVETFFWQKVRGTVMVLAQWDVCY